MSWRWAVATCALLACTRGNEAALREATERGAKRGVRAAVGRSDERCLEDTLVFRCEATDTLLCAKEQAGFLASCVHNAKRTPTFCDGVPLVKTELTGLTHRKWIATRCAELTHPDDTCRLAMTALIELCVEEHQGVTAPSLGDAPALEVKTWSATSADGTRTLSHVADAAGNCQVTCGAGASLQWSSRACMGNTADRVFVANDCSRVVVVHTAPLHSEFWSSKEVADVYAQSKREYGVAAGTMVKNAAALSAASWLRGVNGVDGDAPRYSDDGQRVVLDTVDGQRHEIPLVQRR